METLAEPTFWVPRNLPGRKPAYLEIADAIAEDIRTGRLHPMDRLPPQRNLAAHLGINFATVARAYTEARHRGLIDSRVGDGTFIRTHRSSGAPVQVDMTMNLPPQPENAVVLERMRQGLVELAQQGNLNSLLQYQEFGGSEVDREAGARWLGPWLADQEPDKVLVCPGAQSALLSLMSGLARPGNVICCEEVTYTGTKAIAAQLGIRLHGLPADDEGIDPDAFEEVCRQAPPKALYLNPVLMNPTTATMSLERRKAVVATARHYDVPIIEDDAYGMLPLERPTALAALAPELTYYISGFA
jgi:DNA-binding transcriptional MocR family regulator